MKTHLNQKYSKKEEFLNVTSHGLGLLLSIIGFPFLIAKGKEIDSNYSLLSFTVFGLSMIVLYAASTFYHAAKKPKQRRLLNIFDHCAIYVLIAGTYTPFALVSIKDSLSWIIFGLAWGFAFVGITLKLFFTGKYDKLSTIMYVLMGWLIVFFINPLVDNLSEEGLYLLIGGGISYTIGAILYAIKKLPYNHAIFHFFVLIGTISHFLCVLFHVS